MAEAVGLDCKFYYSATGISGSPTWIEVPITQEPSLDLSAEEAVLEDRNSIWKRYIAGQLDADMSLRMTAKYGNAVYNAFRTAFLTRNSVLGIAMCSGAIATIGTEVFKADMIVTGWSTTQGLNDVVNVEVKLRIAVTANAPSFADTAS